MAKIRVKYTVEVEQIIDWPDDEMEFFNHDNLVANCEPNDFTTMSRPELISVKVNGKDHNF